MSLGTKGKGKISGRITAVVGIITFLILLGLVHLLRALLDPVYPVSTTIQNYLSTIGLAWVPFDIIFSLICSIITIIQLRNDESLFHRIVDYLTGQFEKVEEKMENMNITTRETHSKVVTIVEMEENHKQFQHVLSAEVEIWQEWDRLNSYYSSL